MGYKFEIWMRWGFLAALVLFIGISFFGFPIYNMMPTIYGSTQTRRPHCGVQISRDASHTAGLGIPAIEAMATGLRGIMFANGLAREACRRDPTLEAVYLSQRCDMYGGGPASRKVFCK